MGRDINYHLLLRHCEPNWSAVDKYLLKGLGVDLVPLTKKGEEQALEVSQSLKLENLTRIVSSPMTRCLQTAAIISRNLNLQLDVAFDLHEWIPDLSMHWPNFEFVKEVEKDRIACGGEWPKNQTRPWETISSVKKRALNVLKSYQDQMPVLFVTHSVVIESLTGVKLPYGSVEKLSLPIKIE